MAQSYYITSREHWGHDNPQARLREKVRDAMRAGVDYVQVREKDLPAAALRDLVAGLVAQRGGAVTRLLVNSRVDVAVASGADGVHLPMPALPLAALRCRLPQLQIVGVSCHNEQEVREAAAAEVDYLLLGPVFATPSKPGAEPLGLKRFHSMCEMSPVPVLALGGVSPGNAAQCVAAGARGIAGIRLFQEAENLPQLIAELRSL